MIIKSPENYERRIRRLERIVEHARNDREKLGELIAHAKELVDQAETVLTNHAGRISQNETDIQAGKEKLIDHEQRLRALEGQ